jgi:hypothetical protein
VGYNVGLFTLATEHLYTVKPVLRGHLWDKKKVVFKDGETFKRVSIHMKFPMT